MTPPKTPEELEEYGCRQVSCSCQPFTDGYELGFLKAVELLRGDEAKSCISDCCWDGDRDRLCDWLETKLEKEGKQNEEVSKCC
jgi:hypothetical protein